jgi:hypothetical protein
VLGQRGRRFHLGHGQRVATRLNSAIYSASNDRVRDTLTCARLLWATTTGTSPAEYRATLRSLEDQIAQPRDMHWAFNMACLAGAAARQQPPMGAWPRDVFGQPVISPSCRKRSGSRWGTST